MAKDREKNQVKLLGVRRVTPSDRGDLAKACSVENYSLHIQNTPSTLFHCLYGNQSAYAALAEILADAEATGHQINTANITAEIGPTKRVGVLSAEDIAAGNHGLINLNRVSSALIAEIASIYQPAAEQAGLTLSKADWRKPIRFMPLFPDLLPEVFDLLKAEILVHPVYLNPERLNTGDQFIHYVASFKTEQVKLLDAQPNVYEPGPHPSQIIL